MALDHQTSLHLAGAGTIGHRRRGVDRAAGTCSGGVADALLLRRIGPRRAAPARHGDRRGRAGAGRLRPRWPRCGGARREAARRTAARSGHPDAGRWELPGGAVERGRTGRRRCVRELAEELGLEVSRGAQVGADVPLARRPRAARVPGRVGGRRAGAPGARRGPLGGRRRAGRPRPRRQRPSAGCPELTRGARLQVPRSGGAARGGVTRRGPRVRRRGPPSRPSCALLAADPGGVDLDQPHLDDGALAAAGQRAAALLLRLAALAHRGTPFARLARRRGSPRCGKVRLTWRTRHSYPAVGVSPVTRAGGGAFDGVDRRVPALD